MQYKKKELYKKLLEIEPSLDSIEYIETLLNFVLNGIKDWSKNPDNLILNVRHFGKFHYRLAKVKRDRFKKEEFSKLDCVKSEEHKRFVEISDFILNLYEGYSKKKQDIRAVRFGEDYKTPKELKEYKKTKLEEEIKIKNENKYTYKILV